MKHNFMERAIELAEQHSEDGKNGPFGAVVVYEDTIVGEGWNQVVQLNDPTAHAEIMAIRKACIQLHTHVLSKCTLYSSCEPCSMCLSAIYWSRIETIVFAGTQDDAAAVGFDDTFIYSELLKPWENRSLKAMTHGRVRAKQVFDKWSTNPHKIHY